MDRLETYIETPRLLRDLQSLAQFFIPYNSPQIELIYDSNPSMDCLELLKTTNDLSKEIKKNIFTVDQVITEIEEYRDFCEIWFKVKFKVLT